MVIEIYLKDILSEIPNSKHNRGKTTANRYI